MKTLFNNYNGIKTWVLLLLATTSFYRLQAQFYKNSGVNTPVCRASYEQFDPVMAEDGNGGAIVVWADKRNNSDYDLYAQRFDSKGKALWTNNGLPVCRISGDQYKPVILPDGNGGALIAWIDTRSSYEIYGQRINSSGGRLWDTAGINICSSGGSKSNLIVHSDYNGGMILVWADMRTDLDIIGQRVDKNGNLIWQSAGLDICVQSGDQNDPSICNDADTAVVIAWDDGRNGKKLLYDIFANKLSIDGTLNWGSGGMQVCSTQDDQLYPKVCSDDSGGAYVVWQDKRSGTNDIYAQKLDVKGASYWTANGNVICSAANGQQTPVIVRDNMGGAFTAWIDQRNSSTNAIYAQRLLYTGSVSWTNNGISICNSNGNRETPNMVEDGEGSCFMVWSDSRNNAYDLFIQKLGSNGSVSFSSGGMLVSNGSGDQIDNTVCTDNSGGLLIAWTDYRNTGTAADIYIQNVQKEGNLGIVSEISVKGNNQNILDNDNTPSTSDNTDMGSTKTMTPVFKSFKIYNYGNDTLKVSSITVSGTNSSNFSIAGISTPANILPKDSTSFDLKYTPSGIGVSNAVVNINNNDSNESVFNFAVRATFKAPKIDVYGNTKLITDGDMTPSESDSTSYGNVRKGSSSNRTFEITSSGTDTLAISSININGTNASDFTLQSLILPRKLNGGKTMSFTVTFQPSNTGTKVATISIVSNDPANPLYEFAISGNSVVPAMTVKGRYRLISNGDITPAVNDGTDWGKVRNNKSVTHQFKIFNNGSDALRIDNIIIEGLNANQFSVGSLSYPAAVPSNDSLSFYITYNPNYTGTHLALLKILNDDPARSTFYFNLAGVSIEPLMLVYGNQKTISWNDTFTETGDGTQYGNLRTGLVKTNRFFIKNAGTDTLRVSGLSARNTGTQGFYLGSLSPGMAILPNDSSYVDIDFKPTLRSQYKSLVKILSDMPGMNEFVFALEGRGVEQKIDVTGNNVAIPKSSTSVQTTNNTDFDSVELTHGKELKYKIVNTGDYKLNLTTIQVSGVDASSFVLQTINFPMDINPGDSLVFGITFTPSTEGPKSAVVTIISDDPVNSSWDFKLAGMGYKKITDLSHPDIMGFSVYPNPASSEIQVKIPENIGTVELSICNMVGQELVKYFSLTAGLFRTDISVLKEGMYLVVLSTSDGRTAKYRLVIRR